MIETNYSLKGRNSIKEDIVKHRRAIQKFEETKKDLRAVLRKYNMGGILEENMMGQENPRNIQMIKDKATQFESEDQNTQAEKRAKISNMRQYINRKTSEIQDRLHNKHKYIEQDRNKIVVAEKLDVMFDDYRNGDEKYEKMKNDQARESYKDLYDIGAAAGQNSITKNIDNKLFLASLLKDRKVGEEKWSEKYAASIKIDSKRGDIEELKTMKKGYTGGLKNCRQTQEIIRQFKSYGTNINNQNTVKKNKDLKIRRDEIRRQYFEENGDNPNLSDQQKMMLWRWAKGCIFRTETSSFKANTKKVDSNSINTIVDQRTPSVQEENHEEEIEIQEEKQEEEAIENDEDHIIEKVLPQLDYVHDQDEMKSLIESEEGDKLKNKSMDFQLTLDEDKFKSKNSIGRGASYGTLAHFVGKDVSEIDYSYSATSKREFGMSLLSKLDGRDKLDEQMGIDVQ